MGFFESVGSRLGSKLATTTPEEASKKLTGVDPIGTAALGMVRDWNTPDVAPEPIKTSTPSSFAEPAQAPAPQGPAPAPIYIPPTYGKVGTGKYQPRTRLTEGQYLPEMQIGTDVKYTAVDPKDADDANIVDYEWQNMGAAGAPFVSPELNPTGRPQAEIIAAMSTQEGYIDPNGFVWRLQADENGNPQYLKGRPIVKTETPIMGTAAEKAIMVGQEGLSASEANINAQRDLELGTIQANQNQVDKRRATEDEILKREEKRNTNLEIANSHFSQLVSELEDQKVNPSRQFQKLTPAGRMARVVYLFTAGMRGPEFLKLAMDQLNADVERDIDAQKQAINAKKDRVNGQLQIIKNMRDQFDTERDADNAEFAIRFRQLGDDMETEIAGIKNAAIRAKAEETLATVRTAQADRALAIETGLAPTVKETDEFDPERVVQTSPGRYVLPPGSDPIQNLQNEAASILANPNRTPKDQARYDWIVKTLDDRKGKAPEDPMLVRDSNSRNGYEVLTNADALDEGAERLAKVLADPKVWVSGSAANKEYHALLNNLKKTVQEGMSEEDAKTAKREIGAFNNAERARVWVHGLATRMRSRAYTDRGVPPPNQKTGGYVE